MTEEKKPSEPTMEEILASIRRIISEDSQNAAADGAAGAAMAAENLAPLRAHPPAADPRLGRDTPAPHVSVYDEPEYDRHNESVVVTPDEDRGEALFDLTDIVPGASSENISAGTDYGGERVLDLTDEVRESSDTPGDTNTVMDLHEAVDTPPPRRTVGELEAQLSPPASVRDDDDAPLLTPRAEAATAGALGRLREASDRRHEAATAALSDNRIEAMIGERIDSVLAARLDPLLRQKIDALLDARLGPALNERLSAILNDRVGPLLDERLDPALRDGLNAELHRRVDPLLDERLPPALRERLEPALRERLDPVLRERLDPMLRDWFDRNLPDIVERVVEREIERLARQSGGG
jgi:cell pole-organizing protein PopZ